MIGLTILAFFFVQELRRLYVPFARVRCVRTRFLQTELPRA